MLSSILPASSLRSNSVNSVAPHVGEKLGDKLFRIRADFQKEFPTRIKKSFLSAASIFFGKCFFFGEKSKNWNRSLIGGEVRDDRNFSKTFFLYRSQFWFRFFSFGFFFTKFLFRWKNCPNKFRLWFRFRRLLFFIFILKLNFESAPV